MTARAIWRSEQPSYEQPIWSSQRPATPPSFHLRTPDDRDLDAVTWTRATTKSVTDYQGNVHQALPGEVTWEGYRRVRNLAQVSENLGGTGWSGGGYTASTAKLLLANAGTSTHYLVHTFAATRKVGERIVFSFDLEKYSDSWVQVAGAAQTFGLNVWATVNLDTGTIGNSGASGTYTVEPCPDNPDAWRVHVAATIVSVADLYCCFVALVGDTNAASRLPSVAATAANGVYIDHLQIESARPGQTTTGGKVSVGVLSTPYHGAKVDGVKWFATDEQGRLIDGTRGYDRDGSGAWVESSSVTPIAPGLSIGSLQTNRITYSSDLTSGWTDSGAGTRTAAYDAQVGVYTQLRSVGASGADDFLYAATGFTGSARTEPAMMLRAVSTSGSLVIENASDNTLGKWTVDLSLVSTTRFERIDRFHAAVTVNTEFTATAGGAAGIRFYVASGTVGFDIALATQVEGTWVDSLIYSAGSVTTKNADYPIAVLPTGNANTIVADYTYHAPTGVAEAGVFAANNSGSSDMLDARAEACYGVAGVGGVNQAVLSFNSAQKAGRFRVAVRGARDNFALIRTGNTLSTDVSGTAPAINQLQLGGLEKVTTYNLRGVLHSISVYPAALTDTQLQALSA